MILEHLLTEKIALFLCDAEILKCNSIGELDSISFYFIHSSCINH